MPYFEYSKSVKDVEYYEILENLMERWEYEIVEFKEAKGGYDTDKIGRYFSAISNEANLRQQQRVFRQIGRRIIMNAQGKALLR